MDSFDKVLIAIFSTIIIISVTAILGYQYWAKEETVIRARVLEEVLIPELRKEIPHFTEVKPPETP